MNKSVVIRAILIVLAFSALILGGCASASKMLDRAESAWSAGQYATAIEYALSSYERAVDRNKEPTEISAAKAFLEERFPQANSYLQDRAESQLNGSDSEKADAWKIYQTLVNMNRRVRDSIAGSFLQTEDFNQQLQKSKDVAAQIQYVKALELMGRDQRSSYIEAYNIFGEIDNFVPDYRDIRILADQCRELATLTVALSDRRVPFVVRNGEAEAYAALAADAYQDIKDFIISNDHPAFLEFVTAGSIKGAQDAGAVLFVEIQGDVWVSADTEDDYGSRGEVTWTRSYGGTPALVVTRADGSRNEIAVANLELEQELSIEFFPVKYNTDSLTMDMYTGQFNNAAWMASQLGSAKNAIRQNGGSDTMVVWAELEYGGRASFLSSARVNTSDGEQDLPIDPAVWQETARFINSTLPSFLAFGDLNVHKMIVNDMTSGFLASSGIRELLSDLEG